MSLARCAPGHSLERLLSERSLTETLERLKAALADRYTLELELGHGGIVHLAEDIRHHRKVAVKVLRPELLPCA